ncbi:hypothetical protein EGH24_12160 [Halonotius terrestris]|uniref:Uncharacterized protein n=1 Tax=Halonotius terrestris TaxID=2487750 RepID=A0A8J8PAJ1_9EURY|nr:hypothetical protein [Halonotius terrestris]TQQ79142.1 hypothetical protein EGH24_12160 [Halonotius terrestris]
MSSRAIPEPPSLAPLNNENEDLIEQFRRQIEKLNEYVVAKDPKYVVALSRSGPRLLERAEEEELIDFGDKIVTEKALPYIDDEEIETADVVVMDDILIAGTTVWNFVSELALKYDLDASQLTVVTLAIDSDCQGLFSEEECDRIPANEVDLVLNEETDHMAVPFKTFLSTSVRKRFKFSKDLIHTIATLNKPYDIDYALINAVFSTADFERLKDKYQSKELTTTQQSRRGLRRMSVLVPPKDGLQFHDVVFDGVEPENKINKLRVYFDREAGSVTIAPMYMFSVASSILETDAAFDSEEFGYLNEFVDEWTGHIEDEDERQKCKFRLIWFFVSYLFGVFVEETIFDDEVDIAQSTGPRQHLNYSDLKMVFGEKVSSEILKFIDLHRGDFVSSLSESPAEDQNDETVEFDVELSADFADDPAEIYSKIDDKDYVDEEDPLKGISTVEDGEYEEITSNDDKYIDRISDANNLHSNLAIIFESMYSNIECLAQAASSRFNGHQDYIDCWFPRMIERLDSGFTASELAGILSERTEYDFSSPKELRHFSLAFDVLVDKGEQIPIFTKRESDEGTEWTRAYRHGESAFILYDEFHDMMFYAFREILVTKQKRRALPSLVLEKIGVLLWQTLNDQKHIDDLDNPGHPESIHIKNTFLPYGNTLDVVEDTSDFQEGYEYDEIAMNSSGDNLVKWAKRVDMLEKSEDDDGMYKIAKGASANLSDSMIHLKSSEDNYGFRSNSAQIVQEAESLARALYWVHDKFDKDSADAKYLIGLTSCSDAKSFLHAIQEELRLLLDYRWSNRYHYTDDETRQSNVELFLDKLEDMISERTLDDYMKGDLESRDLLTDKADLKRPTTQLDLKLEAWDEMDDIATDIENNFNERHELRVQTVEGAETVWDLYNATGLPDFLDKVKDRHESHLVPTKTEHFLEFTKDFGEICGEYYSLLREFYDLSYQIKNFDDVNWQATLEDYHEQVASFNEHLSTLGGEADPNRFEEYYRQLADLSVSELSELHPDKLSEAETKSCLLQRLEDYDEIYQTLKYIYEAEYSKEEFRDRLKEAPSSVWKREHKFGLHASVSNADDDPEITHELVKLGKTNDLEWFVADDALEMKKLVTDLLTLVDGHDTAELTLGIVTKSDVNHKINTSEKFDKVDNGDHMHVSMGLAEFEPDGGDGVETPDGSHKICVAPGVRNEWGGVLPDELESLVSFANSGGEARWELDVIRFSNGSKELKVGWGHIEPSPNFSTEVRELDYYEE